MEWLRRAAIPYNIDSFEQRDRYGCHVCIPIDSLIRVVNWSMEYFPEEVLIGFDPTTTRNPDIVEETFGPPRSVFSGAGYILGEPHLLNVGDEFSVEHISEDWLDGALSANRGSRGSRFSTYLHSHPNAFAGPSQSDASASDFTEGVEMILGVEVENPPLGLEWYEQEGTHRRRLGEERPEGEILARLAGRRILGMELIGFIRGGLAANILITDEDGFPLGLDL